MNNIYKVFKYQIHDFWKAVLVFCFINILITSSISATVAINGESISFGGLEMATVIFLFVAGLNCFKSNFKFMLANNVSRKGFYFGNAIALVTVSAFMALVDAILNVIFNNVFVLNIPYEGVVMQLYRNNSFFAGFLWCFGLNTFAVCFGWFITMLYYRCNSIMKIVVSFLPVLSLTILYLYQLIELVYPVPDNSLLFLLWCKFRSHPYSVYILHMPQIKFLPYNTIILCKTYHLLL
jgi:hypothetical protein